MYTDILNNNEMKHFLMKLSNRKKEIIGEMNAVNYRMDTLRKELSRIDEVLETFKVE